MHEILKIKAHLETMRYMSPDSLFELRMVLMNTCTFLTARHLANQRIDRNPVVSSLLLRVFRNIQRYYQALETTKELHEPVFDNIRELTRQDMAGLYKGLRTQKSNVFTLPQEDFFPLGLGR